MYVLGGIQITVTANGISLKIVIHTSVADEA